LLFSATGERIADSKYSPSDQFHECETHKTLTQVEIYAAETHI